MDRQVTRTRKDHQGDITALCNPGATWSPRPKQSAINDIEQHTHTYYTQVGGSRANILVVNDHGNKYLRTHEDMTKHNNLDDLPNC